MEPRRDKNGLTEEEYLANYKPGNYPRPSMTVDLCVLRRQNGGLSALLVRRGGHPYLGCWALPGGFVGPQETAEAAAARELEEETSVRGLTLHPVGVFSAPGRDPRGWTISAAYAALCGEDAAVRAGDDAADAQWFSVALQPCGPERLLTLTGAQETLRARVRCTACDTPFGRDVRCELLHQEGLAFDHGAMLCQVLCLLS